MRKLVQRLKGPRLAVRAVRVFVMTLFFLGAAAAQPSRNAASPGVALAVHTADDLEKAWGLRDGELLDAAGRGVRLAGWTVDERSGLLITVEIACLTQENEDLFPLRLSVRGSAAEADSAGPGSGPHEVTASRVIEVPWSDHERISAAVQGMVSRVARKMLVDNFH